MKLTNRLTAGISAAVFLMSSLSAAVSLSAAADDLLCVSYSGTNIGAYDYNRWASTINTGLVPEKHGAWMRVQGGLSAESGKTVIEYYDADFQITGRKRIVQQLPLFGGFHRASDGTFYLITGQQNSAKDDTVPVFDVAAYSHDWELLGHDQILGGNTTDPFNSGTVRCDDNGKYLFVHTCHEMYGGHQANVTIQVDMSTHKISDASYEIESGTGDVSHSFNQFILLEDDSIIMLDHGDFYPRSAVLQKLAKGFSGGNFHDTYSTDITTLDVLPFPDPSDPEDMYEVNYTGTAIGGFAASSTHYLVAYNQIDMTKIKEYSADFFETNTRNIYIASVPKRCR